MQAERGLAYVKSGQLDDGSMMLLPTTVRRSTLLNSTLPSVMGTRGARATSASG
jgi:hypothetical protein